MPGTGAAGSVLGLVGLAAVFLGLDEIECDCLSHSDLISLAVHTSVLSNGP